MACATLTTLAEIDDRDLIDSVSRGDAVAFAELHRRYAKQIRSIARSVVIDDRVAEDVTQEVFASLWQHADRVDPRRGELRTLLLSMARYRAIDAVRRETSKRRRHEMEHMQPQTQQDRIGCDIAEMVIEADALVRRSCTVREAIERLPEPQRTSIELAYFGGHTFCEVARITGVPEGTAKSRLAAGLRSLERRLSATLVDADNRFVTVGRRSS